VRGSSPLSSTNVARFALLPHVIAAARYLLVGGGSILLVLQSGGYVAQLSAYVSQSVQHAPTAAATADMPDDMDGMVMNAPPAGR
jgi:hypothetical protein